MTRGKEKSWADETRLVNSASPSTHFDANIYFVGDTAVGRKMFSSFQMAWLCFILFDFAPKALPEDPSPNSSGLHIWSFKGGSLRQYIRFAPGKGFYLQLGGRIIIFDWQ